MTAIGREGTVSLDDRLAEGWLQLSRVRRGNGDLDGAHAALERARELDPQNPLVLSGSGGPLATESRAGARIGIRRRTAAGRSAFTDESVWSSRTFELRLGRFAESERTIERIRSIDPKSVIYLFVPGILAISRGRSSRCHQTSGRLCEGRSCRFGLNPFAHRDALLRAWGCGRCEILE